MASEGVYRTCHCRAPATTGADGKRKPGRLLGKECPDREKKGHTRWYSRYDVPTADGKRRQVRAGPFEKEEQAEAARRDALTEKATGRPADDKNTLVRDYLDRWLDWKVTGPDPLKPSTAASYRESIQLYFKPALGHHKMGDLREVHLQRLYRAMKMLNTPAEEGSRDEYLRRLKEARATWHGKRISARPVSDARIRRVHAVFRAATNDAEIQYNPAAGLKLGKARKIKPKLWTGPRVERWLETGEIPGKVMVWDREQTQAVLDFIEASGFRLFPMYLLAARYGPRRSELAGLMRSELDLARRRMSISLAQVDEELDTTKSEDSDRQVVIDPGTAAALKALRKAQKAEQLAWGPGYRDSGRVFSREDGPPLRPEWISERFTSFIRAYQQIQAAGSNPDVAALARQYQVSEAAVKVALAGPPVPPVHLHCLRHGSATMLRAAGVPTKVIAEILGHSNPSFTDTVYGTAAEEMLDSAAAAIEAYLPREAAR